MNKRLENLEKGYKSLDSRDRAYILRLSRALAFAAREAGVKPASNNRQNRNSMGNRILAEGGADTDAAGLR